MYIKHDIPLKKQTSSSNCVQTSTSQLLGFYDTKVNPDTIERDVPVREDDDGNPVGTLLADIGTWSIEKEGFSASMHVFDTQIVDRSWVNLSQDDLLSKFKLMKRQSIKTARTYYAPYLIDAYINFMEAGGKVVIDKCTNSLLKKLLKNGPFLAIVSFNYLYDYPRSAYNSIDKNYEADPANGKALEHAILITGYENDKYSYNDPDSEMGGQKIVTDDVLIGAICTAQLNSDNYLLVLNKS